MSDHELRALLLDKRADLLARMAGISAPPTDSGGISFGKRVGDGTSIAVERLTQVAAHEQMLTQLADVDRSLVKLDEGTYGCCDICGDAIPAGRLEVHPWATRCVKDAEVTASS
jgi:RNA polymerase-binding transcription factor DksA